MRRGMKKHLSYQWIALVALGTFATSAIGQESANPSSNSRTGAASDTRAESSSARPAAGDSGGVASSTSPSPAAGPGTSASGNASAIPDGLVMQNGTVLFYKHGKPQRIDKETKLSEGITVDKEGNLTLKDGTKTQLKDGQMVTLDGKIMSVPSASSGSDASTPRGASSSSTTTETDRSSTSGNASGSATRSGAGSATGSATGTGAGAGGTSGALGTSSSATGTSGGTSR